MTRHARIEIVPATYRDSWNKVDRPQGADRPPAKRPHYLRLVAANGETLAHSETFTTRQNARRGVKAWCAAFVQVLAAERDDRVVEYDIDGKQVRP